MRYLWICLFIAALCAFSSGASAETFPLSGGFSIVNWDSETVMLYGPEFSVSGFYSMAGYMVNTSGGAVFIADYEDPIDGRPYSEGTFNGATGVVWGGLGFSMNLSSSLSNVPVTFTGGATAYTCLPALPSGCWQGTELWSVDMSGTGLGDATLIEPGGQLDTLDVSNITGTVTVTADPAPEPSTWLLTALAPLLIFFLRPLHAPAPLIRYRLVSTPPQ